MKGLLITIVAALALVACSDDDASQAADAALTTTVAPSTTTTTEPVCTPAAAYAAGTTTHGLTVAGTERSFLVRIPPNPSDGMPLVVDFHGAGSNMEQQSVYSGFDPLADAEGFVVATPNGVDAQVRQWRFLGTQDDVDFARAIVDTLVADACVDAARVYAVGMSSGAAMSASLACQASETFAGYGMVTANFYVPQLCDSAAQRPIIVFHGTDDPVVPYAGGPINTGAGIQVAPAEQTAAAWANHNGCTGGPNETVVDTEVVRIDWTGCAEPVVMYRIVGGGHTWPGAIDIARLGSTTHQISATDEMWRLFEGG